MLADLSSSQLWEHDRAPVRIRGTKLEQLMTTRGRSAATRPTPIEIERPIGCGNQLSSRMPGNERLPRVGSTPEPATLPDMTIMLIADRNPNQTSRPASPTPSPGQGSGRPISRTEFQENRGTWRPVVRSAGVRQKRAPSRPRLRSTSAVRGPRPRPPLERRARGGSAAGRRRGRPAQRGWRTS